MLPKLSVKTEVLDINVFPLTIAIAPPYSALQLIKVEFFIVSVANNP